MIKFVFTVGKAFLDYSHHPITIPKAHYGQLEREALAVDAISLVSPFGGSSGSIKYSVAGFGPYYQLTMNRELSNDPMLSFRLGQRLVIELERVGEKVRARIRTE
jgi:hypothetical protein